MHRNLAQNRYISSVHLPYYKPVVPDNFDIELISTDQLCAEQFQKYNESIMAVSHILQAPQLKSVEMKHKTTFTKFL